MRLKTHRPLAFAVPAYLVPLLTRYCALYRPYLLALRSSRGKSRQDSLEAAGNRLWVSQYGTLMTPGAQTKALKKYTVSRFGRFVNPHLFRDCVATSIANESPEHVLITAQILGHSSMNTTEQYYIQAQANIATARYHDQILAMRAGEKKKTSRLLLHPGAAYGWLTEASRIDGGLLALCEVSSGLWLDRIAPGSAANC